MKLVALTVLFFGLVLGAIAQDAKQSVGSLGWISGCWELNKNGRVTTERWAKPTENLMLGTSQTVKDGRSLDFEFLRIAHDGQELAYIAKPASAKTETAFPVSKIGGKQVVFENLKHDFPQRIIYSMKTADSLVARIEGTMDGNLKGIDFPMTRAKCE